MKRSPFLMVPLLLLLMQLGNSCATIVPPQGGPRDTLAPRLLKATPANGSLNVNTRKLVLSFDEYIDLNTQGGGTLIMSPLYQKQPKVTAHLRTLTIELRDSLEANTTYSFSFDGTIKDINEGNQVKNLNYVFSTGPALDSLTLSGAVQLARTGKVDTTLTVALYRTGADSAIINENPRYITSLNGAGRFTFRNLPAGKFYVYAMSTSAGSRRYPGKSKPFAFLDSAVTVAPGAGGEHQLFAFVEDTAAAARSTTPAGPKPSPQPATDRRLKWTPMPVSGGLDLKGEYRISFDNRVTRIDSSKLRLTTDSSYRNVGKRLSLDSTGRVLTLRTDWTPGESYALILEKDFATDSTGRSQTRNDTLQFSVKKVSDYGHIVLRFRNVQPALNPVLELVQNDQVVFSAPITSAGIDRSLFPPGDYDIRVLFDRNRNGVYDTGRFFGSKRQPELVVPIERKLNVKPDLDTEVELAVPDLPGK